MTSESDVHTNRDEVHLLPVVFTPAPPARATRQVKPAWLCKATKQPVMLLHSRNRRGSGRIRADATASTSTRTFTVIEQTPAKSFRFHQPVFLTLGLFDKLVYLSFLVSCFPFFHALGGFGVDVERPGTIVGGTNTRRVLANRTTPSEGNITDIASTTDLGAAIRGDGPDEIFGVGRISTIPKSRKALSTPLTTLPTQTQALLRSSPTVQASPVNLPWPLVTPPSADYIFDFGLPGDVYALRIHSPHDLVARAEQPEYGERRRSRRRVLAKGG
jgi:hypothetical protein